MDSIILGGGCFWCLEAVYQRMEGVISVQSGYAGGLAETANYEAVCSGLTDHVEVVKVTFDSAVCKLEDVLEVFWTIHDPTTPNRQGNDVGPQYRSAIFYSNAQEKELAEKSVRDIANSLYDQPVVTELLPLEIFYPAEDYHQDYFIRTGNRNPYCTFVVNPKVQKFKKSFADKWKKDL
jgi:peptide-methionine (S)-S-oxide reductase